MRKGQRHTPESKRKMSEAKSGKNHPMHGKTPSPETRAKISKANQGKTRSPETRAKLSEVNQGKTLSPETKDAISVAQTSKNRILSAQELEELLEEAREKTPVFEARYDEYFGDPEKEEQLLKDVRELINTIPSMDKIENGMTATTFQYYLGPLRVVRNRLMSRASARNRKTKPATQ